MIKQRSSSVHGRKPWAILSRIMNLMAVYGKVLVHKGDEVYTLTSICRSARSAGVQGGWKIVKAIEPAQERQFYQPIDTLRELRDGERASVPRNPIRRRSEQDIREEQERDRILLMRNIPRSSLDARWESIQIMMEMSDIGTFEYNSEGKLLHANEAWYRLRCVHTRQQCIVHLLIDSLQFTSKKPPLTCGVFLHGSRVSRRSKSRHVYVEYVVNGQTNHFRNAMEVACRF